MRVVVAGASGQIGSQVARLLTGAGHDVIAASRHCGVDAAIGLGLDAALDGAEVVVDALNSPSTADEPALAFFTATSANLTVTAKAAGVKHYVLLSIVGVGSLGGAGYLQGKSVQEDTVRASGLPYTIVRSTQFHELAGSIVDSLVTDSGVRAPDALIQPVASAEVAAFITRLCTQEPANGVIQIAGPEAMPFTQLCRLVLDARGEQLPVLLDTSATYFGIPVEFDSLIPRRGPVEIAATHLSDWLDTQ